MYPFSNINVIYNRYCRDTIQKRKFAVPDDTKYNKDRAVQLNMYTCTYEGVRTIVELPGGHDIG